MRRVLCGVLVACWLAGGSVAQASDSWEVVLSERTPGSPLVLPGLPSFDTVWSIDAVDIARNGSQAPVQFRLQRDGNEEHWFFNGEQLVPYAVTLAGGETGPGRVGTENGDVFRSIPSWPVGVRLGPGAERIFLAQAGPPPPVSTSFSSYGVWVSDDHANREIARSRSGYPGQAYSPLDPSLDNLYRFFSGGPFVHRLWSLSDGDAAFVASVVPIESPYLYPSDAVIRHKSGMGNQLCAFIGMSHVSVSADGRIFVGVSDVVEEVCKLDGSRQTLAQTGYMTPLGPQLPEGENARFTGFSAPVLTRHGLPLFFASADSYSWYGQGIFYHQDGENWPLVLTGRGGDFGSNYRDKPFANFVPASMTARGGYLLFNGAVPPDSGSINIDGIWIVHPDNRIEPVAIAGTSEPEYSPAFGRIWDFEPYYSPHTMSMVASGDILLWSRVQPENAWSLWRLSPGEAPVEVLKAGDLIEVPTGTGPILAAVQSVDGWQSVSEHGHILMRVTLDHGLGTVYVRSRAGVRDSIFDDGFQ